MTEPDELHSGRGVYVSARAVFAVVMALFTGLAVILGTIAWWARTPSVRQSSPEWSEWVRDPVGFMMTGLYELILFMVLNPWTGLFPLALFAVLAALGLYYRPGVDR
jgi:hypothetical protein